MQIEREDEAGISFFGKLVLTPDGGMTQDEAVRGGCEAVLLYCKLSGEEQASSNWKIAGQIDRNIIFSVSFSKLKLKSRGSRMEATEFLLTSRRQLFHS